MSQDETSTGYEEAAEDVEEGEEAEGVEEIEMKAPALTAADAEALDRETLDGLEDDERTSLVAAGGEAGAEALVAATGSMALSKNFVLSEFHCCRGHCPGASVPSAAIPALRRLVTHVLQPMRERFGRCTVHSGYRNAQHNAHVGGVANSRHRYDVNPATPASDVSFASGNVEAWATEARQRLQTLGNIGGVGRYPNQGFVHVDLGPKRNW